MAGRGEPEWRKWFDVYAEGGQTIVRCNRCVKIWRYVWPVDLAALVAIAEEHDHGRQG